MPGRPSLERLIERHRPTPDKENLPAHGTMQTLNQYGLLEEAIERQILRQASQAGVNPEDVERPIVVSRIVAWEVLAEAQRAGLKLPQRRPPINA